MIPAIFLLISASLAGAQVTASSCPPEALPPTPAQVQEGLKSAKDRGFLWRASKDGRTSYLYGTMHVAKLDWMFPGATVAQALRASDTLALELDVLDPEIMKRFQEAIGPRPDRLLPKALIDRVRVQLRAACLPEQLLAVMAPEMVAATLSVMAARREGLDPAYGIDAFYAGMARGLRKDVLSLETPELQLKLILGSTTEDTAEAVASALEELEGGTAAPMLIRVARMWSEGRISELETYEQWCDCLKTEADRTTMKRMLDERNPGLVSGIDAIHAAGKRVFAAVGSLHMIGELGLPSLLSKRGYQVERVEFKP